MGKTLPVLIMVILVIVMVFTGCQSTGATTSATTSTVSTPIETKTTTITTSITTTSATTTTTPPETTETQTPTTTTPEETTTTPTVYIPSFTVTHMATDKDRKYITSGEVVSCNLLVSMAATEANPPGYYTIELLSRYISFGAKELKYFRGDAIDALSWKISGGDTWLALEEGELLESLFSLKFTYAPYTPKFAVIKGTPPTAIEDAVSVIINDYRIRAGAPVLTWNQDIQDDARTIAMNMLVEGNAINTLESPYNGQLIFTSKTFSTESAEDIAVKAYNFWMSKSETKNILISADFTKMAVGYVVESKESVYYIEVLFSGE